MGIRQNFLLICKSVIFRYFQIATGWGSFVHFFFLFLILNVKGKLAGFGMEDQLPTVAVVTHYDSFGAASVKLI
jgi:hypothetical protein